MKAIWRPEYKDERINLGGNPHIQIVTRIFFFFCNAFQTCFVTLCRNSILSIFCRYISIVVYKMAEHFVKKICIFRFLWSDLEFPFFVVFVVFIQFFVVVVFIQFFCCCFYSVFCCFYSVFLCLIRNSLFGFAFFFFSNLFFLNSFFFCF